MQGYQVLKENFYEVCRRRELKLDEVALAIYLRGKYCFFRAPVFYLSDKQIYEELNTSRRVLDKVRKRLQIKGLIKYNPGDGRGNTTSYTMIDSVMAPYLDKKVYQTVNKGVPKRTPFHTGKVYQMVQPNIRVTNSNIKVSKNNKKTSKRWENPSTHIRDEIKKLLSKNSKNV